MSATARNTPLPSDVELNDMLSTSYLIRNGLSDEPVPNLGQYSTEQLRTAAAAIRTQPGEIQPDNSTKFSCAVADEAIEGLRHWSIIHHTGHSRPGLILGSI